MDGFTKWYAIDLPNLALINESNITSIMVSTKIQWDEHLYGKV